MAEQEYLYGCYIHCSCNNCNLAARPGHSNHQSGHALDLNASDPAVGAWLKAHAGEYGFRNTIAGRTLALGVLAMNRTHPRHGARDRLGARRRRLLLSPATAPRALPSSIIPIITPVIDLRVAEDVLEAMERIPGDEVTVVLHTLGGCVTSCVLIANALRQFGVDGRRPVHGDLGRHADRAQRPPPADGPQRALSAVDPIVEGSGRAPAGGRVEEGARRARARVPAGDHATCRTRSWRVCPGVEREEARPGDGRVHGRARAARVADPPRRGRGARARGQPGGARRGRRWWTHTESGGGDDDRRHTAVVAKVACEAVREDAPVEVVDGSLCSAAELRRAVVAGAITSGVVCALAGVGIGYLLGLRDGKE
jgi:hypothetical protein